MTGCTCESQGTSSGIGPDQFCPRHGEFTSLPVAIEEIRRLRSEVERLSADEAHGEIHDLVALIGDLADEDPCYFDHHGGCQAHGYLSLQPGEVCPQEEAKDVIARYAQEASP